MAHHLPTYDQPVIVERSSAEIGQILVAEVSVVVEVALARDYGLEEVVEVLPDTHGSSWWKRNITDRGFSN